MLETEYQEKHIGQEFGRFENAALITGQSRFLGGLPTAPGAVHAAILRSPDDAHAEIISIDFPRSEAVAIWAIRRQNSKGKK